MTRKKGKTIGGKHLNCKIIYIYTSYIVVKVKSIEAHLHYTTYEYTIVILAYENNCWCHALFLEISESIVKRESKYDTIMPAIYHSV